VYLDVTDEAQRRLAALPLGAGGPPAPPEWQGMHVVGAGALSPGCSSDLAGADLGRAVFTQGGVQGGSAPQPGTQQGEMAQQAQQAPVLLAPVTSDDSDDTGGDCGGWESDFQDDCSRSWPAGRDAEMHQRRSVSRAEDAAGHGSALAAGGWRQAQGGGANRAIVGTGRLLHMAPGRTWAAAARSASPPLVPEPGPASDLQPSHAGSVGGVAALETAGVPGEQQTASGGPGSAAAAAAAARAASVWWSRAASSWAPHEALLAAGAQVGWGGVLAGRCQT
jgi:hypothetical protein